MFVDIYALQAVPPSNINRDDTGSPKTALFGGVQRARVSSQAWKRAMRRMFSELLPAEKLGLRTKLAVAKIAQVICEQRPDLTEESKTLAEAPLKAAGVKVSASKRKGANEGEASTDYLIFIAQSEISGLAELAIRWHDEDKPVDKPTQEMKKETSSIFHGAQAVDIALFGRMLADAPDLNTDASAQVAHAISVNAVAQEYDYFTAVDDCAADDNAGAGMLGTVAFNSSTLFRYATVNIDALNEQLGDSNATAEALKAFVAAFTRSMPTGKQNTFANRTLPSTLVVAFRKDQPINPVSAFEQPIYYREKSSISDQAAKRLADELEDLENSYGMEPTAIWNVSVHPQSFCGLGECVSYDQLLQLVNKEALSALGTEEE